MQGKEQHASCKEHDFNLDFVSMLQQSCSRTPTNIDKILAVYEYEFIKIYLIQEACFLFTRVFY